MNRYTFDDISCAFDDEDLETREFVKASDVEDLEKKLAASESLNVYFRDAIGECHLMISRKTSEYQVRKEWECTDLPPRLQTVMKRIEELELALSAETSGLLERAERAKADRDTAKENAAYMLKLYSKECDRSLETEARRDKAEALNGRLVAALEEWIKDSGRYDITETPASVVESFMRFAETRKENTP